MRTRGKIPIASNREFVSDEQRRQAGVPAALLWRAGVDGMPRPELCRESRGRDTSLPDRKIDEDSASDEGRMIEMLGTESKGRNSAGLVRGVSSCRAERPATCRRYGAQRRSVICRTLSLKAASHASNPV